MITQPASMPALHRLPLAPETDRTPPVPAAFLRIGPDLTVDGCWGECRAILGRGDELAGQWIPEILHPGDRDSLAFLLEPVEESDDAAGCRHLRLRDGSGLYRVIVARRGSGGPRISPGPDSGVTLELQNARDEPHRMGDVITPVVSVMMESTDDFIFFKNEHHILLTGSRSMVAVCDGVRHWRELAGKSDYELFPEYLADRYYALEQRVYAGETSAKEVQPFLRRDGSNGWIDNRKYAVHDAHGRVIGLYGVARDITAQIEAVVAQELAASVFAFSSEGIVILDGAGIVVDVNAAMCRGLRRDRKDLIGQSLRNIKHSADSDERFATLWAELQREGHWDGEVHSRGPNGAREEMARLNAVRGEDGETHHYIGLYTDITKLKQHEAKLQRIAHFDPLTGLANRKLLADRLDQALAASDRRGSRLAIAFMDLDGFKQINDNFSHQLGDEFLVGLARRLKAVLRETDTLARVGGDEFVAVITDFDEVAMLEPVVQRLLEAAAAPLSLETAGVTLQASASIGISLYPRDGGDADMLLRRADQAMYVAKHRGKNRTHYCDSDSELPSVVAPHKQRR